MEAFLLVLLGIIVYLIYIVIEFAIPIVLIYLLIAHPHNSALWIWATLLIIWFIARMVIYIIKESKKNGK